jgi:putative transposase
MRKARIKITGRSAVYHCVSRVVGGDFLLSDVSKEKLKSILWHQAEFSGIEIITYCIMSNHFHVLVRVPELSEVSDEKLLRRSVALYGDKGLWPELIRADLKSNNAISGHVRNALTSRMSDLSVFMKEVKQRFSRWYNGQSNRYGTLWAERFRSVLVEDSPSAVGAVAAYIDLNPIRAGLATDPKDYRFCGYAEALSGGLQAQQGISSFHDTSNWSATSEEYRKRMFVRSGHSGHSGKHELSRKAIAAELKAGGKLSAVCLFRLRIRYMTDGAVLGSEAFVEQTFQEFRDRFGPNRKSGSRKFRCNGFNQLRSAKDLHVDVFS